MSSSEIRVSYAGLVVGPEDIAYIRDVAQRFDGLSRKELTATLCEHLGWLTAAGQPRRGAAAEVLSRLEAAGAVSLPMLRKELSFPGKRTRRAPRHRERTNPGAPLRCRLKALPPIQLGWAATAAQASLCNEYLARYHPLGYHKPFGYWGRYLISADNHRLGCILLSGPTRALAKRDQWIGWDPQQRRQNLSRVVNNSRFLIFPWVQVPHLASHVLGQLARRLADDWDHHWGFRPWLLETFVDPAHYRGSCYRAAGWRHLGHTSGRGLARAGHVYHSTPKLIFTKPLQADFRRLLCTPPVKESFIMSKPSRRPGREEIKELRRKKNANIGHCANSSEQTA